MVAGLLWAAGVTALSDVVWLVPRTMAGIDAYVAGVLMLGWRVQPTRVWHSVLTLNSRSSSSGMSVLQSNTLRSGAP